MIEPMPFTFQGIGTSLYGQTDFRPDGTFVTTEFLVLFYVPIQPLRSLRVAFDPERNSGFGPYYQSTGYRIYENCSLNLKQVLSVYGFALFGISWAVLLFLIYTPLREKIGNDLTIGVLIFSVCIPAAIPLILRARSRRKSASKIGL